MRKILLSLVAIIATIGFSPIAAQAKTEQTAGVRYSGNMTMTGRVAGSYKKFTRAKSKYRTTKSKYRKAKRSYRGKSKSRRGRRYASKKSGRRSAKGRSFTRYARKGGGSSGGTGCLTSAARNLLGRIRAKFGNVQIVSTCRPGARIAGSGKPSKHASGNAIDFRVPGRKAAVISWLRANHRSGGIMTYSDMDHIHVDIGYRFVALGRRSGRS